MGSTITGPGRRAGLDRDDVVARATAIVEADGPGALSMRKLAAELGVTTTTVYWHVGNRDQLVQAIIEHVSRQLGATEVEGDDPRQRLASLAQAVWRSAFEHRHVTALAHQVGATSLLERELEVAMVIELEAAGLRGAAVRDALRSILMCTAGFLVVALRRGHPDPAELWSSGWSGATAPPMSEETRAALAEPIDVDALFATAVDAVIAAHLPRPGDPPGRSPTPSPIPSEASTHG
jgi:AcrR family transcriptional regulator